jgi:hypothetical protein
MSLLPDPKNISMFVPRLRKQEKSKDPVAYLHFSVPNTYWHWYATEFDGQNEFFGWIFGHETEPGYFLLSEFEEFNRTNPVLQVVWDEKFTPRPISEVKRIHGK